MTEEPHKKAVQPLTTSDLDNVSGGSSMNPLNAIPDLEFLTGSKPEPTTYTIFNPANVTSLSSIPVAVFFQGGFENDRLSLTEQNDIFFANRGDDYANGAGGDDLLIGDGVHTGLSGPQGSTVTFNPNQWDTAPGDDTLVGGDGADTLFGDTEQQSGVGGDDFLAGGYNDRAGDLAFGGGGQDTFFWERGSGNDTFHGGEGTDTLWVHNLWTSDTVTYSINEGTLTHIGGREYAVLDAAGNPVTFSGTITIGGETITFTGLERIKF